MDGGLLVQILGTPLLLLPNLSSQVYKPVRLEALTVSPLNVPLPGHECIGIEGIQGVYHLLPRLDFREHAAWGRIVLEA